MAFTAAAVLFGLALTALAAGPGPRAVVRNFFQAGVRGDVAAMKRMCSLRAANHGETGHGVFWWAFAAVGRSIVKLDSPRVGKKKKWAMVLVTYNRRRMLSLAKGLMAGHIARLGNKLKQAHAKRIMERFLKLIKTKPPKIRIILVKDDGRWLINKFKSP
jgi:hypothetical protein